MIVPICCMRDQLTGFMNPFVVSNLDVAKRDFKIIVNDDTQSLHYNPQHFDLYHVGDFNTETGELLPCPADLILTGMSVIEEK